MSEELAIIEAPPCEAITTLAAQSIEAQYQGASTLVITPEESAQLQAPFDPNDVEIRPDGLIYLPQSFTRQRLNQALGIGQWALVEIAVHQDDNHLYYDGALFIRGHFVARGTGEAQRYARNPMTSWASVKESAKSDCLVRCCKDLSIAAELWQPKFSRAWIAEHATKVYNENSNKENKWEWRRNDNPFWWENGGQSGGESRGENAPVSEMTMWMGDKKGTKLSEMTDAEITKAIKWCEEKGKFENKVAAAKKFMEARTASQTEPPASESAKPAPTPELYTAPEMTRDEAAAFPVPAGGKKGQRADSLTEDEISTAIQHIEKSIADGKALSAEIHTFLAALKRLELPF